MALHIHCEIVRAFNVKIKKMLPVECKKLKIFVFAVKIFVLKRNNLARI